MRPGRRRETLNARRQDIENVIFRNLPARGGPREGWAKLPTLPTPYHSRLPPPILTPAQERDGPWHFPD